MAGAIGRYRADRMSTGRTQLDALTGIRFVAASAVVFHHFATALLPAGYARNASLAGFVGVDLFFVLSGFVLAYAYRPWGRSVDWRRFLAARVARIYPLFIVSLLLAAPFYLPAIIERRGFVAGAARASLSVVLHATLTHGWVGHTGIWNFPDWSLSCEWAFYLSFPLIAPRLLRVRRPLLAAVAVWAVGLVPALAYHSYRPEYVGEASTSVVAGQIAFHPVFRVYEFLVGALLGKAYVLAPTRFVSQTTTLLAFGVLAIVLANSTHFPRLAVGGLLMPVWAALILSLASGRGLVARALSIPSMLALGEASYGIYLLHAPLHFWLERTPLFPAGGRSGWLAFALYLALLTLVSLGAFKWIEVPWRSKIREYVERRLAPRVETR